MSRTYLKLINNNWEVVKEPTNFWLDYPLLQKINSVISIQSKGWDGVIIIDGKERSGKSVLGMAIAWYISKGKMGINNFAKGLSDASKKIASLPDKSVLIMDEGSLVFSSKDSRTSAQNKLIKLMDVVGQKNMVFIVCLPCYFDLNKTIAVRRSLFLCHVYPDAEYNRGQYAFWGEQSKKTLYIHGKKNYDSYNFPDAEFVGEFLDFEPPFYKEYLEIVKKQSLQEVLDNAQEKDTKDNRAMVQRNKMVLVFHNVFKLSQTKIAKLFKDNGIDLSRERISNIINDFEPISSEVNGGNSQEY